MPFCELHVQWTRPIQFALHPDHVPFGFRARNRQNFQNKKITNILGKAVTHNTDGTLTSIATPVPVSFRGATWNLIPKATTILQANGATHAYRYMYDGKRFYKTTPSSVRTYYIFAGDTLIGEITGSTPTFAYTWGPDGLISQRNLSSSTSFWYEFGPQGETRSITNGSATVTDTYNYSAYGEQIASSGTTVNPYRYKGKYGYYTDTSVGLILATQRWYSPQLMRWISRDPIGYQGGVNLYEYVKLPIVVVMVVWLLLHK